jgi:HEAT repeat protein
MQVVDDFDKFVEELGQRDLSRSVLYKLSNLHGAELDLLAEMWPSLPDDRRRSVIAQLTDIAEADFEADFTEVFKICLTDADELVRTMAVEGLWEVDDVALVRPLVRMLRQDSSPLVREAVAISLSRFALMAELERLPARLGDLVWDALWDTIHDPGQDVEIRRRAVESLAYFDRPQVKQVIQQAYEDEEPRMRISAVFAMGRSIDDSWTNAVLSELVHEDPEMRYEATRACGQLQLGEAIPALSRMVADPDAEVKLAAVWALGQIGSPEARRVLEICLQMGDEALQDAADEALGELDFMSGALDFTMYDFDMDDEDEDLEPWEGGALVD